MAAMPADRGPGDRGRTDRGQADRGQADRGRPAELEITSPANPRIKQLVALRRRRERERAAVTLVEGLAEVRLALAAGVRPRALYYCPELSSPDGPGPRSASADGPGPDGPGMDGAGPKGAGLDGAGSDGLSSTGQNLASEVATRGGEVIRVTRPVFEKISYREGPDGWLAVVPAIEASLTHLDVPDNPLVMVCAGLEKPGNLGAILRTADAAGVAAVVAADPVTDWGNPNVVRASKGTVFSVPVASGTSAEVLDWIAATNLKVVAATPDARQLITEADLTGPMAIAVGAEQTGLTTEWLDRADLRVRIPMFGRADSLNVSTSAAIITYEAVRQRMEVTDLNSGPPVR
jgi:RNA methyltransferase, TrmH family